MAGKLTLFTAVSYGTLISKFGSSQAIVFRSAVNLFNSTTMSSLLQCTGNKLNLCPFGRMLVCNFNHLILFIFLFILLSFIGASLADFQDKFRHQSCHNKAST